MTVRPDIIEIDEFNLQEEVIDFSVSSIVMMAFWAPWSKESLKVKKTLEDLMDRIAGSVRLALVNIETSPVVTSQFAVFSVPCVKFVFQGQIENQILGLHSTAVYLTALKQINAIDPMTLTLEKAEASLNSGDIVEAKNLYEEFLDERPENPRALFGLAVAYLNDRRWGNAASLLNDFPPSPFYAAAERLLPLAEIMSAFDEGRLTFDEGTEAGLQFCSSIRFLSQGKKELAIESLFELLKMDRAYGNGAARKLVVALLETLPPDNPTRETYRAELAKILF